MRQKLNVARAAASACVVGKKVYVLGGVNDQNTIETRRIEIFPNSGSDYWGLITLQEKKDWLERRAYPILCPLKTSIVIIGGMIDAEHRHELLQFDCLNHKTKHIGNCEYRVSSEWNSTWLDK